MFVAALIFSARNWIWPAGAILAVVLVVLLWAYGRSPVQSGLRFFCIFLKILGTLALIGCLLEPLWTGQRAKPGANLFVVLADNSQGMQIKDVGEVESRGAHLRELLLGKNAAWNSALADQFQVRRYYFDGRLQATRDFSELDFEGRSSAMATSLQRIADRFKGQPLAGVLLLTDGNATDLPDGSFNAVGVPPVFPVVMGRDDVLKDVAIQKVTVNQTSFEDAPVAIQAEVSANGYSGETILLQLLDMQGKKIEEQMAKAKSEHDTLPFHLQLRPEKPGVSFYRLRVSAKNALEQFAHPKTSLEATLANNSRVIVVDRGRLPRRILYVAGRPNWEFKFLNRALADEEQLQLVALIRVAKREPKFDFRGRPGESSNPLYRGFGNQSKEEVERYDQPVLIRLNTKDELELHSGFPKTAEELYAYHAVIFDDLESEFFTRDQMALVQKFVSERGGGFLMLGGAESFQQGKYERTPIGDMLPVYLNHLAETKPLTNLQFSLTREGWLQPWARLRSNENEERSRLENMPRFQVMNAVRDIKPGASVIASVKSAGQGELPALVVQRFGNGRVGALMIGDIWRWGFRDESMHRDMDKAWRQLMRWLVADVPNRVEIQAEPARDADQSMLLQTRARDKVFQPQDNATVSLKVSAFKSDENSFHTNAAVVSLAAEPSLAEAGLYQAGYIPRDAGGYLAEAVVTDANGAEIGRAEAGWAADPAAEEFKSLQPNRSLLETIARKTGGEMVAADQLAAFVKGLPSRQAPVMESWSFPLWHTPTVLLFALACFICEWGLRRWKGMA